MKFFTWFGATSGKKRMSISPALVCSSATLFESWLICLTPCELCLFWCRSFFVVFRGTDDDFIDRDRIGRPVLCAGRSADDLVGHVHPFRDPAKNAVLPVERRSIGNHDEELRRSTVG